MPNHVTNQVSISGNAESLAKLKAVLFAPGIPDSSDDENVGLVVDFNGLIPMPQSLHIEAGSLTYAMQKWNDIDKNQLAAVLQAKYEALYDNLVEHADGQINWKQDKVSDMEALFRQQPDLAAKCGINLDYGEQIRRNIELYGCPTWYEWSNRHWGTKWNAYHQHIGTLSDTEIYVEFDTAWSPPEPVFAAIVETFPDLQLEARYIDEGGGFAGTFYGEDG
ncbi:hypothetical protein HMPREF9123_0086 [Neisseria bacilliformis ATCC BAA-1200]|jgi:hypothetical protein|uniref:YubB ferredoxin-like domain-containing protein n=1 Tax=Neisseria bacilliformis ATCC BAA-1200 TaxID=888742 RepID=F2B8N3_9NEIS|nr:MULTISPECIES: hypothetical protein [Neisseriaceae]EGF12106.1 hypothetical protein HMPREF9123_0086 [Neisseria bacilliformis ATCC BAA-1200]QMT47450.1 hypothetical protein H3L91_11310 [Neisseria bacilliformis]